MKKKEVIRAWGKILTGGYPSLSIEITKECPLRCPGCYAYEPEHLLQTGGLRDLTDYKGSALIENVLKLVRRYRPLHLSIVGGEPLVRFRELNELLPKLSKMGVAVQIVTSAVREIPKAWNEIENLYIVVSIDGLQKEHDARRKPATYERILKNILGHQITVHCTITNQMTKQRDYLRKFLEFWSERTEVKKVWFSFFTPQTGATDEEIVPLPVKHKVLSELAGLRQQFPKLDLPGLVIEGFQNPPQSPEDCIFSKTTINFTADLKTRITPCQFGGTPDCSQCGCIASAGLSAVGNYRLLGFVTLHSIYKLSDKVGKKVSKVFSNEI
jgi:sulfatase maturation enzyme AslB (radical SAM superfamily)